MLRLILPDNESMARSCGLAHTPDDRGEHVIGRGIKNLLSGIEAQAVEVVFIDPVSSVGDEEFTHRSGISAIEINRFTPLVLVTVREVVDRKGLEVITLG